MKRCSSSALILALLVTAGCDFGPKLVPSLAPATSTPTAPMIAEPNLVRIHTGKVILVSLINALADGEEQTPEPNSRFIAVGFPIGPEQTLSVFDYELKAPPDEEWLVPFAVVGESPNSDLFYDPLEFADEVKLKQASAEAADVDAQAEDGPAVASWSTPAKRLILLYEVPLNSTTVTLQHGKRTFVLHPQSGEIEKK
jgi:hypothetical protein